MTSHELYQKLLNSPIPQTGEELFKFVTESFMVIMGNPDNINTLAAQISKAQSDAIKFQAANAQRNREELRLVRVEYPGSIRGVVRIGAEECTVELSRRNEEGEWAPMDLPESTLEALQRRILSEISLSHDETIFLTTEGAYQAELERISLNALELERMSRETPAEEQVEPSADETKH